VAELRCLTKFSFVGEQTAAEDYDFPSSDAEKHPSAV
jgi:hypothetical protein